MGGRAETTRNDLYRGREKETEREREDVCGPREKGEKDERERDHGLVIIRVSCHSFREDDVSKSYMYHHNLTIDNTQGQIEERPAFTFMIKARVWAFQNRFDPRGKKM